MAKNEINILLVDDDDLNCELITKKLKHRENYKFTAANNGFEAIDLLKEKNFDVMLLDIYMPKLNGIETIQLMRDNNLMHDMDIIMMSAESDLETVKKCIRLGACSYITKPFDADALISLIKECSE
ncbi:MAG: response regulator [Methylococcales bacterium]|jgi:CheY-like chemotaxis protein|nr:response regulator [Methylococcales bacterium]MBT7410186.1 response regulator [Methylococcales bacterium]